MESTMTSTLDLTCKGLDLGRGILESRQGMVAMDVDVKGIYRTRPSGFKLFDDFRVFVASFECVPGCEVLPGLMMRAS
jgi:hypothetical protein